MEFDIFASVFISVALLCLVLLSWKLLRPKFPVRVTCWFCGERTTVPWGNKNCWDCPDCEQYNGFDQTGDYNKPIPAQYDDRLNHPTGCDQEEFISGDELLCNRCSQNQLLKVKQLANFVPYSEKNYETEIEAFERHLEKVYQLCLSCQIRVQQELQIQNEALAKRLHNFDVSNESFSSTRKNNSFKMTPDSQLESNLLLKVSLVLHGISLVCAAVLTLGKLQLDGQYNRITSPASLYPVLVWLDRHVSALAMIGLFTGLMAKLFLGKYRLHIIDVISCPVWLLVLLLQTGYIQVQQSWYDVISSTANMLTCAVCLGINRNRRNTANMSMTRLSLDPTESRPGTTVSQFSSVSQPSRYSSQSKYSQQPMARSHDQTYDQSHDSLDDTLTDLDSITLGSPAGLRRTSSQTGIFTTTGQSSSYSNIQNQSVSQSLRKTRPLISPATFSPDSSTPPRNGSSKFGLFSTPQEQRQTSFADQPLSGVTLTSRSFSVPKATTFGSTPYSISPEKTHFSSRSLFNTKYLNSDLSNFSRGKNRSERSFSAYRDGKTSRRIVVRKDMFTEDKDDDRISSYSASTQCPVDSTTSSAYLQRNDPFWKHPGLIGFVLGGSVVANVLLLVNYIWRNNVP